MVNVRVRQDTKKCYFDFQYLGCRVREHSTLPGTKANVEKMKKIAGSGVSVKIHPQFIGGFIR